MADNSDNSAPQPGVSPDHPYLEQTHAYVSHESHNAVRANDEKAPMLPPLPPFGPFFGHWTQGAPHGSKYLQLNPNPPAGNQIPPAGTGFGTQGHPPPGMTLRKQPRSRTEIFHSRDPPPGKFSGNPPPPDAVVFGHSPGPGAKLGNRPPSPAAGVGVHTPNGSNYLRRPMHKCFALASTRVYDKSLRCDRCGARSDLGWYYRCCHETDARLFESIRNGNEEHFDEVGKMHTQNIQQPARGPEARQDKLSPLNELPADQVESLTAPQLVRVLRQHEAAVNAAMTDRHGPSKPSTREKLFLMPQAEECKTSLCPRCGRMGAGEQQSFLSLDGVSKGDIPPTAAVGFGFRALGGRPIANANIVKNLGLRDPKTDLLSGQKAKGTTDVGGEGKEAELVGRMAAVKVDSAGTSHGSEGLKMIDGSHEARDSDEDLVQLYMNPEEVTLANSAQDGEDVVHAEGK